MKIIILSMFLVCLFTPNISYGKDIANCALPAGWAYFMKGGLSKDNTGWVKDKISNGTTQLIQDNEGIDILYVDATKNISSSRGQGAKLFIIDAFEDDISVLVKYPLDTTEVFRFFKESDGSLKYSHYSSKTMAAFAPKVSLMIGECSYINFKDLVDK